MTVSLRTALDIARCVRWDDKREVPLFDCKPEEAYESFKVLREEVLRLQRVEGEAVALATANSDLRSELHALREAIKYVADSPEMPAACDHRFVEEFSSVLQMFVRRCQRCRRSTTLPSGLELLGDDDDE